MELKTSKEWQELCTVQVLDADGWDRKNYDYSWNEELITRKEFEKRLGFSTVIFTLPIYNEDGKVEGIWKDGENLTNSLRDITNKNHPEELPSLKMNHEMEGKVKDIIESWNSTTDIERNGEPFHIVGTSIDVGKAGDKTWDKFTNIPIEDSKSIKVEQSICKHKFEVQDDGELRYYCIKCGLKGEKVDVDFQPIPDNTKFNDEEIDINRVKPLQCQTFFEEEKVTEEECPDCYGRRHFGTMAMDERYDKCRKCNGTGKIKATITTTTNATEEQYVEAINSEEDVTIHTPLNQQVPEYYMKEIKIGIYENKVVKVDWEKLQEANAYTLPIKSIIMYLEEAVEFLKK
jgi:hypothetical protein